MNNYLKGKETIKTMGLMTGTSMDGLDIAIVDIKQSQGKLKPKNIIFNTILFPKKLKKQISNAVSGDETLYKPLDESLGKWMADVCQDFTSQNNISDIDLIGSHGQTVLHESDVKSVQVGNPQFLADMFEVPVIYDFRTADIKAGGTGAPLIPKADEWMFQKEDEAVIMLNIGGVANVTLLPPKGKGDILGFDTGPGMAMLDETYCSHYIEGIDIGGELAKKGFIDKEMVERWMDDPYIQKKPPKSTGRDYFGHAWINAHHEDLNLLSFEDRLANLAFFTAKTIIKGCKSFIKKWNVSEIVVSGGGSHHEQILFHLNRLLRPIQIKKTDEYGLPVDGKEAVGFALLAAAFVKDIPANIPSVTGANKNVILGELAAPAL
ncbi:MAG: anhydro-N-acetylmuramic acid kinase [Candidatus Marinimicrobia bacterium]|jgi:anhydro-N-acetylmuramic acid kinase|nr:anhydro-N-acetylmuramic acid kinase [Candidatus Neomarinimicrobiota bacterium]MBT3936346.1 anhydro-N-acetylmuramic acid kinase [Candidatus Neomarinimicrobiota bacterium]MBT3960298.1 anhydro-N-acetylmuramic acid kinase [Candidatus Neomarinimicrobiota bacterium]MBT4383386.1 anhydro-N-acetylmuramic acid kinase [Candidatus Neomarinimicrobiota bacterium]MBT4635399.1 anhydro-N-acetylmuramic acid kinase [Candidatus Neomarinimicrobiota bacterium]